MPIKERSRKDGVGLFMSQQRGIITDQFINVLQVIQLGRKTGHLSVERGEGAQREEGELLFRHGQIVDVHCGQLHGQSALNWLKTWGVCRFIFVNIQADASTGPLAEIQDQPPPSSLQDTGSTPRTSLTMKQSGEWRAITGSLPAASAFSNEPYRVVPTEQGVQMIAQAGLSRLHRHLFLLLDGQRTVTELARLMGRRTEDMQQLLLDLTRIGIVQ